MKRRFLSAVLDSVTGVTAFGVFIALDTFFHVASDLRTAVISLALLYLCAGLIRGRGGNVWVKGLLVSVGGVLVMLALLWAAIFHVVLAILALTAVLFAFCGVRARRFWTNESAFQASMMILVPTAALVIIALAMMPRLAGGIATRQIANPAPEFTLTRLDGTNVRSSDWHGRVVVLDYWATWCPACRRELPQLEGLYRRYETDPDVVFWAVDVQQSGETPQKASTYFKHANYSLPLAIDSQDSADVLAKRFAFEGFPVLLLIDRSGRVRLVHIGYDGAERLQDNLSKEIEALLKERV